MNPSDPIRVLIVDDESLARDTISLLLEDEERFEVVGEAEDGNEAIAAITELAPDLVFLDIQMPGKNGFEVVEAIGPEAMPVVIFATAYDEYALRAFELHALDYLLKPYDDERFEAALNRAIKQVEQQKMGQMGNQLMVLVSNWRAAQEPAAIAPTPSVSIETPYLERIMVKTRDALFFVHVKDIDWIEAAGDYVVLHVGDQSHLVRDSMTRMEEKLPRRFVRIHRSTIVNIDRINQLKPYFHGDYMVYLKDGTELRLSRRYWSRVEQLMG